jgi:hypothetical protein
VSAKTRLGRDMTEQVPGHVLGAQRPEVDPPVAETLDQKAPQDKPLSSDGERRERPVAPEVGFVPILEPSQWRPVDY